MKKQLTLYIDKGEAVDGEVMPDDFEIPKPGFFSWFASFFHSSHEPYNDNGREYNPKTQNWEYVKPSKSWKDRDDELAKQSADVDNVRVDGWWQ